MKKILGWVLLTPLILIVIVFIIGGCALLIKNVMQSTIFDWYIRLGFLAFFGLSYLGLKLIK